MNITYSDNFLNRQAALKIFFKDDKGKFLLVLVALLGITHGAHIF